MGKMKIKLHILLIGHLPKRPSGSALRFKQLVDNLSENNSVEIQVVNTYRPSHLTKNWLVNIAKALSVTVEILFRLRKAQVVSFHASRPAMMAYAPILFLITRLFKKPLVLRLFGGALELEYEALSPLKRWLFDKTVLSAELLAVQTKHLLRYFEHYSARNIQWFSNSTRIAELPNVNDMTIPRCSRFVFLGIIKEKKGIDIILDCVISLMPGISVDLFGPLEGKFTPEYIQSKGRRVCYYKGVLTQDQVYEELFNYDALILPTYYEGEGYPGVIIQAYSHGLPVIATEWRSIPEIVTEKTGILISPHSPIALAQAMNRLHTDTALYARLKRGAISKRTEFSDKYWTDRFVEWCAELADDAVRQVR